MSWSYAIAALGLMALVAFILWLLARPVRPADTRRLQQLITDLSGLNERVRVLTEQYRQINAEAQAEERSPQ